MQTFRDRVAEWLIHWTCNYEDNMAVGQSPTCVLVSKHLHQPRVSLIFQPLIQAFLPHQLGNHRGSSWQQNCYKSCCWLKSSSEFIVIVAMYTRVYLATLNKIYLYFNPSKSFCLYLQKQIGFVFLNKKTIYSYKYLHRFTFCYLKRKIIKTGKTENSIRILKKSNVY